MASRRTNLEDVAQKHAISSNQPPKDSLFWTLWDAVVTPHEIPEKTLKLNYLQGIKNGTLNPDWYGGYNVADAMYCYHGAKSYEIALQKCEKGTPLYDFLAKKHEGYVTYNKYFSQEWYLLPFSDIALPDVMAVYIENERYVAEHCDPVYLLIAMIPCEYLWAWLALQMGTPSPANVYKSWVTGNADPSGAYRMGNFLVEYQKTHSIDVELAKNIYGRSTLGEATNFAHAGRQTFPSQGLPFKQASDVLNPAK